MKTFYILLFLKYSLFHNNNQFANGSPLIGEKVITATDSELSFVVSLGLAGRYRGWRHFCTGSLISRKHVLTAAHCLYNKTADNVTVSVGSNDFRNGIKYDAQKWLTYEQWAKDNNFGIIYPDNDIAIVTLARGVRGIRYGYVSRKKTCEFAGKTAITAGWGRMMFNVRPMYLQKAMVHVMSVAACRQNTKDMDYDPDSVEPNEICTNARPPVLLGCGDSGGPLFIRGNQIIGVNEARCSTERSSKAYNTHTNTCYYRRFILKAQEL